MFILYSKSIQVSIVFLDHQIKSSHIQHKSQNILPKWKKEENFPPAQLGIYGFQDMFIDWRDHPGHKIYFKMFYILKQNIILNILASLLLVQTGSCL